MVDSTLTAMALVNLGAGIAITTRCRTILRHLAWSCAVSGRASLTYAMVSQADESRSMAIAEFGVTLRRTAQALHRRRS